MTSARQTNFGSRIDFVLATRGLARSSLAGAAVVQSVMGSDHCPVSAVFELSADDCKPGVLMPMLAASSASSHVPVSADCDPDQCDPLRWPQFAAKQKRLSAFFGAAPTAEAAAAAAAVAAADAPEHGPTSQPLPVRAPTAPAAATSSSSSSTSSAAAAAGRRPLKRQASIQSLFGGGAPKRARAVSRPAAAPAAGLSLPEARAAAASSGPAARAGNGVEPAKAWQRLLKGPPKPPQCNCRPRALAVEKRVLKAGENLNRVFYVCSKPAGRKEAGGRCNFFMWGSAWQAKQSSLRK